ncbi:MAG: hypothetical protein RLZZ568_867, partial [Cyanobacteriota bacterium]
MPFDDHYKSYSAVDNSKSVPKMSEPTFIGGRLNRLGNLSLQ